MLREKAREGETTVRPLKTTTRQGDFDSLPEERREAMMRASVAAFGQHSYKDASTEDIARSAGISKGLLFFYFRNKRTLYLRTVDYLMEQAVRDYAEEVRSGAFPTPAHSFSMDEEERARLENRLREAE